MQIRSIVLVATGVATVGCLVALLLQVRSSPEPALPEEELARAQAHYARTAGQDGPPVAQPRPEVRPPTRAPREPAGEPIRRMPAPGPRPDTPDAPAARSADYEARREELSRIYTSHDYAASLALAQELLKEDPGQTTLMRVVVVSACAEGQLALARETYEQLDLRGRRGLVRRCREVGETLLPTRGAGIR